MKTLAILFLCLLLPACASTTSLGNSSDIPYLLRQGSRIDQVYLVGILEGSASGGLFLLDKVPAAGDSEHLRQILDKAPVGQTIFRSHGPDLKTYLSGPLNPHGPGAPPIPDPPTLWLVSTSPTIVLASSRDHSREPRASAMDRDVEECLPHVRLIPDRQEILGVPVDRLLAIPGETAGGNPVVTAVPQPPGTTLETVLKAPKLP